MKRLACVVALALLACSRPKSAPPPQMPDLSSPVAMRAATDAPFRSGPPASAAAAQLTPPVVVERKLSNGVRVLLVERHDVPIVSIRLVSDRGADQAERGIPEFYERTALDASEGHPSWDVSERWVNLGANVDVTTTPDATLLEVDVLSKVLEPALELLGDLVLRPTFPSKMLETTRLRMRARRALSLDRPAVQLEHAIRETLFPAGHPYRELLAPPTSIDKVEAGILEAYHRYAFNAEHTTIVVAGDVSPDAIVPLLEKHFAALKGPKVGPQAPPPSPAEPSGGPRVVLVERKGDPNAHVGIAWLGPIRSVPDRPALRVGIEVLEHRLFTALRQELGSTYGVHVRTRSGRARSPLVIRSVIENALVFASIRRILDEVRRLGAETLEQKALLEGRAAATADVVHAFEAIGSTADALTLLPTYGHPLDWFGRWMASVATVDAAAVQAAMSAHLPLDRARIVVVGNPAVLRPQLEKLGVGPIVVRAELRAGAGP